jgi:hypothetical protein
MVVWLKPCKSRSSPGPYKSNTPDRTVRGIVFYDVWKSPARQGLQDMVRILQRCGAPRSGGLEQVIAKAYKSKPPAQQAGGLCVCARPLNIRITESQRESPYLRVLSAVPPAVTACGEPTCKNGVQVQMAIRNAASTMSASTQTKPPTQARLRSNWAALR